MVGPLTGWTVPVTRSSVIITDAALGEVGGPPVAPVAVVIGARWTTTCSPTATPLGATRLPGARYTVDGVVWIVVTAPCPARSVKVSAVTEVTVPPSAEARAAQRWWGSPTRPPAPSARPPPAVRTTLSVSTPAPRNTPLVSCGTVPPGGCGRPAGRRRSASQVGHSGEEPRHRFVVVRPVAPPLLPTRSAVDTWALPDP